LILVEGFEEEVNLYLYDGLRLKVLNNLFDLEEIKKLGHILIGDNNWLINSFSSEGVYSYDGKMIVDISVNIGTEYIDNAFWNGKYWLIVIHDKKIVKYTPGSLLPEIKDGILIKGGKINDEKIYLIENGRKRQILNEYVFNEKGYKWADVIVVPNSYLEDYPDGDVVIFNNGRAIGYEQTIYIIESGKRREVLGGEYGKVFEYLNLDQEDVLDIKEDELSLISGGEPHSLYKIEKDIICSKRPESDFADYSWNKELLNLVKGLNSTGISDICFNQDNNRIAYFKQGEVSESYPGTYKTTHKVFIFTLNTLTRQVSQLLERESDAYEDCEIDSWYNGSINYSCGIIYCKEYYTIDIDTKINTSNGGDCYY